MIRSLRAGLIACTMILGLAVLGGCTESKETVVKVKPPVSKPEVAAAYGTKLAEDRSVYAGDKADSVVTFYLTVAKHNLTAEHPLSWTQFNSINRVEQNTDDLTMEVILQEGTEEGLSSGMFGYGDTHANGMISIRGKSTIRADQKSFKIKLFKEAGLWRNQGTINLIKHAYDSTRLRNKLSFDYFKLIPDFTSLRTQFVHLYVKDLTGGAGAQFVDYGLYTQIEQPNKTFLRSHGLDPNGNLYKAVDFEFFRYPEELKSAEDPAYDKAKFSQRLEIKGDEHHEKLLGMLDDLNNYSLPIDDVFDKHFDRDNFLTWMAVNILMDNFDTINQNYLLYSPLNSDKWFFLPWDYDGGWGYTEFDKEAAKERPGWQRGIANYWGNVLQKRFFKNPDNVQQLIDKMEQLKSIITVQQTTEFIRTYEKIVSGYVRRLPDLHWLPKPVVEFESELELVKTLPEAAERKFKETLENPMPFYLNESEQEDGSMLFNWDASYDLQGDDISYRFQLARNPSFDNALKDVKSTELSIRIDGLSEGKYYWKVTAIDSKGHEVDAFDTFEDIDGNYYFGVRPFYVD